MTLKDLFAKAGTTPTYEQLEAVMTENKCKFVDLSEGAYVSKQKYDDDLKSRDTRITELDGTIKQRDTDLEGLRTQLAGAGDDKTKLDKANADLADLQAKYQKDTADYQAKLAEQEYAFAVKTYADTKKFTSQAARRDFEASLRAKKLAVENGTLVGANDFADAYAKENADAFASADDNPGDKGKPTFAGPTGSTGGTDPNPIKFDFNHIR